MNLKYNYLIVGSGLFGSIFAYEATKRGKKCLVIDKRKHIGGNIYCENKEGINIHKYGAHIFHTSNKKIWNYVNEFAEFNNYINSPVARYKDELYNFVKETYIGSNYNGGFDSRTDIFATVDFISNSAFSITVSTCK